MMWYECLISIRHNNSHPACCGVEANPVSLLRLAHIRRWACGFSLIRVKMALVGYHGLSLHSVQQVRSINWYQVPGALVHCLSNALSPHGQQFTHHFHEREHFCHWYSDYGGLWSCSFLIILKHYPLWGVIKLFKLKHYSAIFINNISCIPKKIGLHTMLQNCRQLWFFCRQATCFNLSLCWPRSMSSYGITM